MRVRAAVYSTTLSDGYVEEKRCEGVLACDVDCAGYFTNAQQAGSRPRVTRVFAQLQEVL